MHVQRLTMTGRRTIKGIDKNDIKNIRRTDFQFWTLVEFFFILIFCVMPVSVLGMYVYLHMPFQYSFRLVVSDGIMQTENNKPYDTHPCISWRKLLCVKMPWIFASRLWRRQNCIMGLTCTNLLRRAAIGKPPMTKTLEHVNENS